MTIVEKILGLDPETVEQAAAKTDTAPTEAEKKSGDYAKGKFKVKGLTIVIETPKGETRSGKDKDGNAWEVTLPVHYGYVDRSEGKDGDEVDVFIGPDTDSDKVFVVNQKRMDTGAFDEHKCMMCFSSESEAIKAYKASYTKGVADKLLGTVIELPFDEFKDWAVSKHTKHELKKETVSESIVRRLCENAVEGLTFYHGSARKFDKFKLRFDDYGLYFSTDKNYAAGYAEIRAKQVGGTPLVYSVKLNIASPYEIRGEDTKAWEDYTQDRISVSDLKGKGYDGVVMRYEDGEIEAQVFSPEQIHIVSAERAFSVWPGPGMGIMAERALDEGLKRPENFDKVDEGSGWVAYAGGNDWENGATWAAVYFPRGESSERLWIEIAYPEDLDPGSECPSDKQKECSEYGKKAWKAWIKSAKYAHAIKNEYGSNPSWKDAFKTALMSEEVKPYVKDSGFEVTEWKDRAI